MVRKAPRKDELILVFTSGGQTYATVYLTMRQGFKPFRGRLRTGVIDSYIQPKDLLQQVSAAKQIVLVSDPPTRSVAGPIEEMFANRNANVVWGSPCRHCLARGRVRFPRKPIKYGADGICLECAKAQIGKEAQSRGWRLSENTMKHMGRLLERTRDYDEASQSLSPESLLEDDHDPTLFDVIDGVEQHQPKMTFDEIRDSYAEPERADPFLSKLGSLGIMSLLPVQASAVRHGLLDGGNLLVVSSTSSGKTLIAEMTGVPRALEGEKLLYLTPLVALANLRYYEFGEKYQDLGLKTAIRVGVGRIKTGREPKLRTQIKGADIVVGTYEGIEQLLRSGRARDLGKVGVVAVDEIQNLAEPQRGCRLDGLIKKLRVIFPGAQFIYLSATVGNPEDISKKLRATLVSFDGRPVPLERHLYPLESPGRKARLMKHLVEREFAARSPEGYRGQTLVFTNSRRKCHQLAEAISTSTAPVAPYHSGLSYERRRSVESRFVDQKIAGVVTTAALAAGVDLPASQVIFETLAMGMEWITPSEFHQMLGRAGRLGYHGSGKAILLIEPGRRFSRGESRTEDEVALDLLSSGVDPVVMDYDHDDLLEQVLGDISCFGMLTKGELDRLQGYSTGFGSSLGPLVAELLRANLIKKRGDSLVITPVGRIASSYFISPNQAKTLVRDMKKGVKIIEALVGVQAFERVYLSERLQKQIESDTRRRVSVRLFDSDLLEFLVRPSRVRSKWLREVVGRIVLDILSCSCRGAPHCDCGPKKLSEIIIRLRLSGSNPEGIASHLFERYGLEVYPGDALEYLNNAVRIAEALSRFAEVLGRAKIGEEASRLRSRLIG